MHRESKIQVGSIVFYFEFSDVMWKATTASGEDIYLHKITVSGERSAESYIFTEK